MRLACALILGMPLLAQTPGSSFYADLHQFSPGLEGYFQGTQDGQTMSFDTQQDLGLQKDGAKLGLTFEYQGPRFGVEVSTDGQDYKGFRHLDKEITIDGQSFAAGVDASTRTSVRNTTFNWTVRFIKPDPAWVGLDLGIRIWKLDLNARGHDAGSSTDVFAQEHLTVPIPQIGISGGFHAFQDRLVTTASYHLLSYQGASYTHAALDVRVFPIAWLGVRVFVDGESFKVPRGSVQDDLEFKLDRDGAGFGVMVRF